MKTSIKIILLVGALGLLVYSFIPDPIAVDMAPVEVGDLAVTIEAEGKTRIHDIYTVSTPIDGRITRLEIEVGNLVKAGESVLANLYPANPQFLDKRSEIQAQADVDGAKAALSLAVARVKQANVAQSYAESEYLRNKDLFEKKLIPIAQLEQAELHLKNVNAEYETALSTQKVQEASLQAAQTRLLQPDSTELNPNDSLDDCHICIKAPVTGVVLEVFHKSESSAQMGTPLLTIGNPMDLEIELEMLSTNAVNVKAGDRAVIKRWGKDQIINAQVLMVEPAGFTKISALGVEEQRVRVILSFVDDYEKWQSLGHGFRVEAVITIDEAKQVLKVPVSALFREQGQWAVFKVENDKAILQKIKIGRRNEFEAEVLEGLEADTMVIVHAGNNVKNNSTVVTR